MLRQVSKRNPNRCFVMSLPFVHSLWPAFAAQAAVVCIFKKQTLAADTPVQMQALRLRYSCAWLRMEDPVFDISCAPNTHNMFMISSISWRGFFHIRHSERTACDSFAYCKPTAEIIGTVCHKKCHVLENSTTWCWKRHEKTKSWLQRFWMFSFLSQLMLALKLSQLSNCRQRWGGKSWPPKWEDLESWADEDQRKLWFGFLFLVFLEWDVLFLGWGFASSVFILSPGFVLTRILDEMKPHDYLTESHRSSPDSTENFWFLVRQATISQTL